MIERVNPGDSTIPAKGYNEMASASEQVQLWQNSFGKKNPLSKASSGNTLIDGYNFSTTVGMDIFAPVELTAPIPLLTTDDIAYSFNSKRPAFNIKPATEETESFAITQNKINTESVGMVIVQGITTAKIKINNESHEYVKVSSTGGLESSDSGSCRILWKAATTGTIWAVLQLGATANTGAGESYNGYFKVINTSDVTNQKIKIINGLDEAGTTAGTIKLNGFHAPADVKEFAITSYTEIYLESVLIPGTTITATATIKSAASFPTAEQGKDKCLIAIIGWNSETNKIDGEHREDVILEKFIYGRCIDG